jgi:hypothetical protein
MSMIVLICSSLSLQLPTGLATILDSAHRHQAQRCSIVACTSTKRAKTTLFNVHTVIERQGGSLLWPSLNKVEEAPSVAIPCISSGFSSFFFLFLCSSLQLPIRPPPTYLTSRTAREETRTRRSDKNRETERQRQVMAQIRGTAGYNLGHGNPFGGPSRADATSDPSPLDQIREQTSKIEDWLDTLSDPVRPYVLSPFHLALY